ncbi:chromosomal replication initiator protein DnaA [Corynebacterium kroppenstedtii]|uniref:chromosomal replication initiator protein DnaA n=1 Tax=Corynebacterium sp. PCR 32 TaxID=3351342 RepID=UPI0030B6F932
MELGGSPHEFGQSNSDFFATWNSVVAELMAVGLRSDIPGQATDVRITPQDKAWLKQAVPVGLIGGVAVISTPNRTAKGVFERKLGDIISSRLSTVLGEPIKLAISVSSSGAVSEETPQARGGEPQHDDPYTLQYPGYDFTQSNRSSRRTSRSTPKTAPPPTASTAVPPAQPVTADIVSPPWNEGYIDGGDNQRRQDHKPDSEKSWLNENYTFDNLVAGEGNRVVRAAAIAVAENPAQAYNPLFVWGGSGLGKTHILHAIGHRALELRPNLRVRYVSIEEYTNEWINSIRNNRGEDFKRKYRSFDILLVDDIQFLAGKPETQIEFFHNFNALHGAQKQIVLCSDRSPKELTELEDRLRTRFQWGFTQDIQKPDLETRIAILRLKAERENADVPNEVLSFIAEQKAESVRELEGALNKVLIVSSIQNTPVTLDMARDQLQDLVAPEVVEITAPTIMSVTAEYFNLTTADLTGPGKARPIAHARQVAMYLCRELTDLSLPKVGNNFGGRDHTTAMYAERKIRKEITEKRSTSEAIQEITARIKNQAR